MAEDEIPPERLGAMFASFIERIAAMAQAPASPLFDRIAAHLGADPSELPVVLEQFDTFDQPNLQRALGAYLAEAGRTSELFGVAMDNKRFMALGLSEMVTRPGGGRPALQLGPVDFVNFRLADGEMLACVQFGLYLIAAGASRLVVLITGPSEMGDPRRQKLRVEVMAADAAAAEAFLVEIRELVDHLNVYRGHTIALSSGIQIGPGPQTLVEFVPVPRVERDDVVLPAGLLERVERHTVGFSEHASELLKARRSLRRGILLYGLPGTGKTLTVMYLASQMRGRTVILTTGSGLGLIQTVTKMARQLAPSMVVLEDVDLVAEERTRAGFGARTVLFELLNEMDGFRDDQDVIFALTTNRPDILEPALAARPGRIDLAVELPLPDAEGRRHLVALYSRGLDIAGIDVDALIDRTEGASPAFIKELCRSASLHAIELRGGAEIRQEDIDSALAELAQGGALAERILGFRPAGESTAPAGVDRRARIPPGWQGPPTGFPTIQAFTKREG